ncbi:hypothetical protein CHELA20_52029 [Hyphomicrobiales bacterium]|nr:hypothetical protein CHELA41_22895 [Hyphomicrobiales bacterium]CAH1680166.1 hypothetical protein CHELA20_52029 [Hyphomicrobiales bacterium]
MIFSEIVESGDNSSRVDLKSYASCYKSPRSTLRKPHLTIAALLSGGFVPASRWIRPHNGRLALERPLPREPGVYAFVQGERALYVGIAASGLNSRFSAYVSSGASDPTHLRMQALLVEALESSAFLDILTIAPPNSSWNGWPVNASAGLEVGLIAHYDLPWNIRGAGKIRERRRRAIPPETALCQ